MIWFNSLKIDRQSFIYKFLFLIVELCAQQYLCNFFVIALTDILKFKKIMLLSALKFHVDNHI